MRAEPYLCQQTVANGPSGRIFRGVETATGRWVRLKVLHEKDGCPSPLHVETLALCMPPLLWWRHPRVSALLAWCPTEETPVLVHEWCAGCDGWSLPHRQRLSAADLRALSWQLIEVLVSAQMHGLCHGALHPGNLGVTGTQGGMQLFVRDWGIGLARRCFMPEAMGCWSPARLQAGAASPVDDLFAAGCALHYLACAALPMGVAAAPQLLEGWQRAAVAQNLARCRPDLDGPWLQWLERLMKTVSQGGFARADEALQAWPTAPANRPARVPTAPCPQASRPFRPPRPKAAVVQPKPALVAGAMALKIIRILVLAAVLAAAMRLGGSQWYRPWWEWLRLRWQGQAAASSVAGPNAQAKAARGLLCKDLCIEMRGRATLQLAEVEAWGGGNNLAPLGKAWQSSTYRGAEAARAIDGRHEGRDADHSQTQGADKDPQWRLIWLKPQRLERLVIWNRRGETASRLRDFTLTLRDEYGQVLWRRSVADPPMPSLELRLDEPASGVAGNP